jgi:hypothetical protein
MEAATLRRELKTYIDEIPTGDLGALQPLLSMLARPRLNAKSGEKGYTVEPASPEECAMVEERVRDYYEDPESFVPLESIE